MEQGLVTIVLPIYNVEKYLERCINSVVNQTYKNLEIILVNDGSTDRSPELCEKWVNKDKRIIVIHKENSGAGLARNTGIENAHGEYIYFFDSDDYIDLYTIEKLYNLAKQTQADLVLFGSYKVNEKNKIIKKLIPTTPRTIYEGNEIQSILLPEILAADPITKISANLSISAWSCFYSTEVIKKTKWKFVSEREYISEDLYSLLLLYKDIKKIAILKEGLYYYYTNTLSFTQTFRKDRYEKTKHCYDSCVELCDKLNYNQEIKERLKYRHIANVLGCLKGIITSNNSKKEKKEMIKYIIHDIHFQNIIYNISLNNESTSRFLLFKAMRKKMTNSVYLFLKMKYQV